MKNKNNLLKIEKKKFLEGKNYGKIFQAGILRTPFTTK